MKGHWAEYQGGTVAPYSITRSISQRDFPVAASQQASWHFGPSVMTQSPATAGMVRDMPWLWATITR